MEKLDFATKLLRRYEGELKRFLAAPDPKAENYRSRSGYVSAVSKRSLAIKNRKQWIFNLKHYGLKDFPISSFSNNSNL